MTKGWWVISIIPFLFFSLVMFLGLYPTLNHDNFPAVLILYVILGFVYVVIYQVFQNTYTRIRQNERARLLEMQLAMHKQNEKQIQFLCHDMRHYMHSIAAFLREDKIAEALCFIEQLDTSTLRTEAIRWCQNDTLNAVLSYYLNMAKQENIKIAARLDLPDELPVAAADLTTVFANAIENAVNACRRQPEGAERRLVLNAIATPQLVIEISNTYGGKISFGTDGLPLPSEKGHGIGTRSIMRFAKCYEASCHFSIKYGMFCMQLMMKVGGVPTPKTGAHKKIP